MRYQSELNAREFREQIRKLGETLRAEIEAQVTGFGQDPAALKKRRDKADADLEFFARTYFPHYVQGPGSKLHDWLYKRLPKVAKYMGGTKLAIAAPRGEAKSTLVSQIFVIWLVVTQRRHYICLVMDAFEQAAEMMEAIRAELDTNPRLAMDYPSSTGQGRVWQQGVIVTTNNRKVQAFGSGKRMRGRRHGPHRPDLVVLDDLENDENVQSPEQRDKLQRWISKTVLKLGDADDTLDVVYIGTILHYDSVLARTIKNPLWESASFKAIEQWPDRMDLWERWEELYLNEGEAAAKAFYAGHKKLMEAGAVVSWPAKRPLPVLMRIRARDGHAAFDSELQNDPISQEDAPFHTFHYWVSLEPDLVCFGAVDPSLGKSGKGRDPSAILVGGWNRKIFKLSVIEALVANRLPDLIIEDIIRLQQKYRCRVWGVESVQFQEFFRTELAKRGAARGIPIPARAVLPHSDKDLRIASLQPHVVNGDILLHTTHQALLNQLRHWPMADHDDGPDALHMLWTLASTSHTGSGVFQTSGIRRASACLDGFF